MHAHFAMCRRAGRATAILAMLAGSAISKPIQGQEMPAADPADVESIDAIIAALYDVISGPAGPRDWDRFRSLFSHDARLASVQRPQGRDPVLWVGAPDDYVARSGPFFENNPFFENELARIAERFGGIAHVFSTYESRREPGAEPFARGINSIQLHHDGRRWWIVTVLWDSERPGQLIPARYLGG